VLSRHLAQIALHRLFAAAVAAVERALFSIRCARRLAGYGRQLLPGQQWPPAQMHVQLCIEHPFQAALHHQPQQLIELIDRRRLVGELLRQLLGPGL
jgi:hypothetical protein